MKDTTEIKNKIIHFLENHGPSLPIHLARKIEMDMIFASAFLSELLSEKRIKMTQMSIGSSRIYYLDKQEEKLERIALENLKNKELEAFQKLKENKFLENSKQEPAIKIALNSIPDFAKKIENQGEIIWKYFLETSDFKIKETPLEIIKVQEKEIPEKIPEEIIKKPIIKKKIIKRKTPPSQKKNAKFFNKVKEHLNEREIEIIDIESFNKNDLILRIKENQKESLLVCFNKKRITEKDILNANKKSNQENLKYTILSLGDPAKKISNIIEAIKNLNSLEKIE